MEIYNKKKHGSFVNYLKEINEEAINVLTNLKVINPQFGCGQINEVEMNYGMSDIFVFIKFGNSTRKISLKNAINSGTICFQNNDIPLIENIKLSFNNYREELKNQNKTNIEVEKTSDIDSSSEEKPIINEEILPTKRNKKAYDLENFKELTNINKYVKSHDKILGRDDEMLLLLEILLRKQKPNVLIVGEPGIGKTQLVYELARRINNKEVPVFLKDKIIYEVDITGVLAGTKYRGEFEEKLMNIINAAKKNPDAILFIDEIHNIVKAGESIGGIEAGNILKPYLSRGEIQVIGATTFDEYVKIFEKDKALNRRFQMINLEELDEKCTKDILLSVLPSYFEHYSLEIANQNVLDKIIHYCKKYMTTRYFPDKAIDVLDLSFSRAMMKEKKLVDEEDVIKVIESLSNVKIAHEDKAEKLKCTLKEKIVGQNQVIDQIVNNVRYIEKGMVDENRPLGVYLFVGPTGVGKTETAKIIAETYFGTKSKLIKIDMSQYMEPHSVTKLIGIQSGYSLDNGQTYLVDEVRKNPYSVILLDEIEKAHKDVLNIFLNIFDEGYLIDSNKRKVDFTNTIIILTSNLGYGNKNDVYFADHSLNFRVKSSITNHFTPEFLNRIDTIVRFNSLDKESCSKLARRYINDYLLSLEENITIQNYLINELLLEQNIEKYGARGIKRAVKKLIFEIIDSPTEGLA